MKKGKEKREENYIKKGEKALKCIFLGYNLNKKIAGGSSDQNAQYISLLHNLNAAYQPSNLWAILPKYNSECPERD